MRCIKNTRRVENVLHPSHLAPLDSRGAIPPQLADLPCIFNTSLYSMVYLLSTLGGGGQIFCCCFYKLIMPSHLAKLCKSAKFKIYFQIGYCTLTRVHLPLMDEQSVKCAIKIFFVCYSFELLFEK